MTCESGLEFIARPTPYPREPFQLGSGELVGFEGKFYSAPAYALLADLRVMAPEEDHPVANPFKLYINKDAGLSASIEPTLNASGYEVATPHYADYITDMREAIDDVAVLHANDSPHPAALFKIAHLKRQRIPYDLDNSSASGTSDGDYVHPTPAAGVPTGTELGAGYMQDIDLDEVMWQPFTRPKDKKILTIANVPVEPIFPAALANGSLPSFSSLDDQKWGVLGYGAGASGGLIITGDRLLEGSSIKLLSGSGQTGASEGALLSRADWTLFPSERELCRYYVASESGITISASGRQSVYDVPSSVPSGSVLLLDVSDVGVSGEIIQTYPANYQATSGVRGSDRTVHDGVHNVTKLLYNINSMVPGQPIPGRSPINGATVFAHFTGEEVGSKGQTANTSPRYANQDVIYGYGGITDPLVGALGSPISEVEWFTTSNLFSPLSWSQFQTTAYGPSFNPFGGIVGTTFDTADINFAPNDGVVTRKVYAQWGFIDQVVCPDQDRAQGGQREEFIITYTTRTFSEGSTAGGEFIWIEDPGSPTISTNTVAIFVDTYDVGNIFSFFFFRNFRRSYGWVNVNGNIYFQWGEQTDPIHKFAPLGARQSELVPATSRSTVISSIGFFPSWKLKLSITTNNQVTKPTTMGLSPASSALLTFAPELGLTISDVDFFGPAVWDPENSINYIYFRTKPSKGRACYFAKFGTDFEITEMNKVEDTDAILTGRMALLSI